jgi:hypothetical protein
MQLVICHLSRVCKLISGIKVEEIAEGLKKIAYWNFTFYTLHQIGRYLSE